MDNAKQMEAIVRFHSHLQQRAGRPICQELVAKMWIRKYALLWRQHNGKPKQHTN